VINLGNGRPFSLKDFISLVETCVGKKARIQVFKKRAHNFNYLQKIS
jgi:UDP-glucose 4-epimerase